MYIATTVAHPSEQFMKELQSMFPEVPSYTFREGENIIWLVFGGAMSVINPTLTPMSNPRVIVESVGTTMTLHLEAHLRRIKFFPVQGNEQELYSLIQSLNTNSRYVLCKGLPDVLMKEVKFESKSLRRWSPVFSRSDHIECLTWYKPIKSVKEQSVVCPNCTRLLYHLQDTLRKRKSLSPITRNKRVKASSKYPKKYFTPKSSLRTKSFKHWRDKKQLRKYDMDVSEMSNNDVLALVAEIENKSKKQLEDLLEEADRTGMQFKLIITP